MGEAYLCAQDDPEMLEMFRESFQIKALPGTATYLAWRDQTGLLGGWMFERYTGPGGVVHTHWAARAKKRWISRDKLEIAAAYIFGQLQCKAALGEAPRNDTYVCKLNEKLGFKPLAVIDEYFPDGDLVIYRMRKDDCRWLPVGLREGGDHG